MNAWIVAFVRLMVDVNLYFAIPSSLFVGTKPGGFYSTSTGQYLKVVTAFFYVIVWFVVLKYIFEPAFYPFLYGTLETSLAAWPDPEGFVVGVVLSGLAFYLFQSKKPS